MQWDLENYFKIVKIVRNIMVYFCPCHCHALSVMVASFALMKSAVSTELCCEKITKKTIAPLYLLIISFICVRMVTSGSG